MFIFLFSINTLRPHGLAGMLNYLSNCTQHKYTICDTFVTTNSDIFVTFRR